MWISCWGNTAVWWWQFKRWENIYIFLISHNSIIFPVNVECVVFVVLLYAKSTYKSILKSCKVKRKRKSWSSLNVRLRPASHTSSLFYFLAKNLLLLIFRLILQIFVLVIGRYPWIIRVQTHSCLTQFIVLRKELFTSKKMKKSWRKFFSVTWILEITVARWPPLRSYYILPSSVIYDWTWDAAKWNQFVHE